MDTDKIKDIVGSLLEILFLGIPLLVSVWQHRKKEQNPGKRKKMVYIFILIIAGCFYLGLIGINKVNQGAISRSQSERKIDSLNNTIRDIREYLHSDSIQNVKFDSILLSDYGIERDKTNDKPVKAKNYFNIYQNRDIIVH
ncbi:MAG: hypothetical protein QM764_22085 [Chitinophagaceae bacterium]